MSTIRWTGAIFAAALLMVGACGCEVGDKAKDLQVQTADAADSGPPDRSEPFVPLSKADVDYRAKAIKGPPTYRVKMETSKGDILIDVYRGWSPQGADRFKELVESGYYDDCRFFRVLQGFMAQVGINGDPAVSDKWDGKTIPDDMVAVSNRRGFVTFAKTGLPNSRTTQIFINYRDNGNLDGMGFSPFGVVVDGQKAADALYGGYGEGAPQGRGPDQQTAQARGNEYLNAKFPKLDYIKKATIVPVTTTTEKADAKKAEDKGAKKDASPKAESK